jgi:hypothetical protein
MINGTCQSPPLCNRVTGGWHVSDTTGSLIFGGHDGITHGIMTASDI